MENEWASLVSRLQGRKVLVAGDMIADVYIDGRISRISREAPVLVLEQAGEKLVAGGAANVANNIATLGGKVLAAGVTGRDKEAAGLKEILVANGVGTEGFFADEARPTISKTRILAGGRATVQQQIVRLDRESHAPMPAHLEQALLAYLDRVLPEVEGIVLSDYGAGTLTEAVTDKLLGYARAHGVPSMVDSRYDIGRFQGVGYIKQNDEELAAAVARRLSTEQELRTAGNELLGRLGADGLLCTRGEKGMTLFLRGRSYDIPVRDCSEVYDVSGAGDTAVAAFMLGLAAGIAPAQAAELSNDASGIAVRKLGTATVSAAELLAVEQRRNGETKGKGEPA